MTAVNTWLAPGWRDPAREEPHAYLQCDVCWPPRVMTASEEDLRACGWRFPDLERGPHVCPTCPSRRRRRKRLSPPSKHPALPNMLVIGAEKSGTTSLHNYLALHPEVNMARDKELNFFQDPGCLDELDEYAAYFDARKPVRGESCPTYTVHPLMPGAPRRIAAAVPDAKLIYIVRDPVDRAIADHAQFSRLWLMRPAEQMFTNLEHPYHAYMAPGRYATQLQRCLESFPSEQVLVLDQADLLNERRETLRRVFAFLGVDENFASPDFDRLANTRDSVPISTPLRRLVARSRLVSGTRRLPLGVQEPLVAVGNRVMAIGVKREPVAISEDLRERLREAYRDETGRLREMTGMAFATWQV